MYNTLKRYEKSLEETNLISKDDVAKIEATLNSNFITENIALDKFSKTKTTLYANKVKEIIKNKIIEYENSNKPQFTTMINNALDLKFKLKEEKIIWDSKDFIYKTKLLFDLKYLKHDDEKNEFVEASEYELLENYLFKPEIRELLCSKLPPDNSPGVSRDEYDYMNNEMNDGFIYYIYNFNKPDTSDIRHSYSKKLTIKDFKEIFIEKHEEVSSNFDIILNKLTYLIHDFYLPGAITKLKEHNEEILIMLNNFNKIKDQQHIYSFIKDLK